MAQEALQMDRDRPRAGAGQTVGLLGGSFDPAHKGHVHITCEALRRFRLDRVWWLVSPGNPLKGAPAANLDRRIARARRLVRHPRVDVTGIEARLGTRYTAQTLHRLRDMYPRVRFVWLMGADNLASFHRWEDWRDIMAMVPVGVLARPGAGVSARFSPAARTFRRHRLRGRYAPALARRRPPAWCYINVPLVDLSSTEIRQKGEWKEPEPA